MPRLPDRRGRRARRQEEHGSLAAQVPRKAKHKPKIWGLHNYVDANAFKSAGTKRMLRAVKGKIWFTETGGLVKRYQRKRPGVRARWVRHSLKHAGKATKYVFKLAKLSSRVDMVFFYHFMPSPRKGATWDSALIDSKGRARPSYRVVKSYRRSTAADAAARRARRPRRTARGAGPSAARSTPVAASSATT